jgi:hypothetical protein
LLCSQLKAPARLVAHLRVVHDAASEIVTGLKAYFPKLEFDSDAVLFGSAIHDLEKCLHQHELYESGDQHEEDGFALLEKLGVDSALAKFCRTHGAWSREEMTLDDLLVALADTVWKGKRIEKLELKVLNQIVEQTNIEKWNIFADLDTLLTRVCIKGNDRLAWQATFENFEQVSKIFNSSINLPTRRGVIPTASAITFSFLPAIHFGPLLLLLRVARCLKRC